MKIENKPQKHKDKDILQDDFRNEINIWYVVVWPVKSTSISPGCISRQ